MILKPDISLEIVPGAEPFEFGSGSQAILFIHGWSSSPRDLRSLAGALSSQYYCKSVLLNGHGGSSHRNLLAYHWEDFYATVLNAFDELHNSYESVSVVGLSFGGVLALHLAKERPVKNLILIAPFIRTPKLPIPLLCVGDIVRFLPSVDFSFQKSSNSAIDNPSARAEHITYKKMHIRTLKELFKGVRVFSQNLDIISAPTLLLHSVRDRTSSFSNSTYILKKIGSQDKHLIGYSNCNHIITLDYEREQVSERIIEWLRRH